MKVKCPYCKVKGPRYSGEDCMGNEVKYTCKHCKGTGEIEEEDIKQEYKIPAGKTKFSIHNGYFEMADSEHATPELHLEIIIMQKKSRIVERHLFLKIHSWTYSESGDEGSFKKYVRQEMKLENSG